MLGYQAFPAISLFVLVGATVLSVWKIRNLQSQNDNAVSDPIEQHQAMQRWWGDHKRTARFVLVVIMALSLSGESWLLFLCYLFSFGILVYAVKFFARFGMANRLAIGGSCLFGLILLGQLAGSTTGDQEMHFLDQALVPAVFLSGAGILALLFALLGIRRAFAESHIVHRAQARVIIIFSPILLLILVPAILWLMRPTLCPATPEQIKQYVESFDSAPYSSASWQQWEISARWAVESKLEPDFAKPRQLLATEIAGEQNPSVLSSAASVGLLSPDQFDQLREYASMRRDFVEVSAFMKNQMIPSIGLYEWVIRAAVLRNDLTPKERDFLEQRLHATLEAESDSKYATLEELLQATQLLEVIGRPVKPERYRARIHALLREFHSLGGFFARAGGFRHYRHTPASMPGDPQSTAHAVELMAIYGVPDGLDMNWVRSYLRPSRYADRKWIAAVTRDRLNQLPNVREPTWLDYLYYEQTLLAAGVLVGLCLYATLCSPIPKATGL